MATDALFREFAGDVLRNNGVEGFEIPDFKTIEHSHEHDVLFQAGCGDERLRDAHAALMIAGQLLGQTHDFGFEAHNVQ